MPVFFFFFSNNIEPASTFHALTRPLLSNFFKQQVEGIGTFVVPFGSEPAASLTLFADRVVGAGGTLNAQGAAQIMERACAEVRV